MDYWARARYDLGLSDREFFALTPRQFDLLCRRRREDLAHRELVSGWTTAAVINHSMSPPDEPVTALQFMPNHRDSVTAAAEPQFDEETIERMSDYQTRVHDLAARLKAEQQANG